MALTVSGISYAYYKNKLTLTKKTWNKASERSKRVLFWCILVWIGFRIAYFYIGYWNVKPYASTICALEFLQNIPVALMYVCFVVFQMFLMRIYIILVKKDTTRNRLYIYIYLWSWIVILFFS